MSFWFGFITIAAAASAIALHELLLAYLSVGTNEISLMLGCNLLFSFFSVSFSTLVFLVFSPFYSNRALYMLLTLLLLLRKSRQCAQMRAPPVHT
jgi:hypothetical protein